MPGFVKTPRDEHLWSKAKARAAAEGHTEDWAYITGIFKHMKGGNLEKSAAGHLGKAWSNIKGLVSGARLGGLQKHLIRRQAKYRHIDESVDNALNRVFNRSKALHIAKKHKLDPEYISKLERQVLERHENRSKLIDQLKAYEPRKEKAERLAAKFQGRANLISNIGAGALGAGGAGTVVYVHKKKKNSVVPPEQAKTAEEQDSKVNMKKLMGYAAASGAAMGATKGFGEDYIKDKILNVIARHPETKIHPKILKHLPWMTARSITGGIGAAIGAGSMALGLKASKKKEEKKS